MLVVITIRKPYEVTSALDCWHKATGGWRRNSSRQKQERLSAVIPTMGFSLHDFSIDALNHLNVVRLHWCALEMPAVFADN